MAKLSSERICFAPHFGCVAFAVDGVAGEEGQNERKQQVLRDYIARLQEFYKYARSTGDQGEMYSMCSSQSRAKLAHLRVSVDDDMD
jgi:hypothetical protein